MEGSGGTGGTYYADIGVLTYVQETVSGAATLLQELPVVGAVCKTFLLFEGHVEQAKSNRAELAELQTLCNVVIKGFLERSSNHLCDAPHDALDALKRQVKEAEVVAERCRDGGVAKKFLVSRKISKDIASIRQNVLDLSATIGLALSNDLCVKLDDMAEKFQALYLSGKEVSKNEPDENDKTRVYSKEARKVPPGAPRIRDWYVPRETVMAKACDLLGIRISGGAPDEPRVVGLAGPGGAGKSTVASMLVAREDVRAFFHKGVLWLQVGKGAKERLSDLMFDLALKVWEMVLKKDARQPHKAKVGLNSEDGAAYIRGVVDESSRRFLVVADDVWEEEVLTELKRAGVWVLFTTRDHELVPDAPPLWVDKVLVEEAEMVLKRAADLDDNARLPDAAYELMKRCDYVVLDLALVGRWDEVRERVDGKAWQGVLDRIVKAQNDGDGEEPLPWRAAVLRAGLDVLTTDRPQNKVLYLGLAVIPQGLGFPSEVAAVLLYGDDFSVDDLKATETVLQTLERLSILAREDEECGWYRVHEDHYDFARECLSTNQGTRDIALPRWRRYISSVEALVTYSSVWLVKVWGELAKIERGDVVRRPYEAALGAIDLSNGRRPAILEKAAEFHFCREDWSEACEKYSELLGVKERSAGPDHRDVARILHSLGWCAYEEGREKETEDYLRRALTIQEDMRGDARPLASTLHSLGVCTRDAGQTEEAEKFLRRALSIRKKLGDDDLHVARTQHSLGVCAYYKEGSGRLEEAESLLREALAGRRKSLGDDHIEVANTLHHLGRCLHKAGRTAEAQGCLQRALGIYDKKMMSDHTDAADALQALGRCAFDEGRTEKAEELFQRALVIREEKLDAHHWKLVHTRHALWECAMKAGRTEEAAELHQRALSVREKEIREDHREVVKTPPAWIAGPREGTGGLLW